jgi:hypothetical protein
MVWGRWLKHEVAEVVAVVDRIRLGTGDGTLIGEGYFVSTCGTGEGYVSRQDIFRKLDGGYALHWR